MSEFMITPDSLTQSVNNQKQIAQNLSTYLNDIKGVSSFVKTGFQGNDIAKIASVIDSISVKVEAEKKAVTSLSKTLEEIVSTYKKYETQISGVKVSIEKVGEPSSSTTNDKDINDTALEWSKSLLSLLKKITGENGFDGGKNLINYWQSLLDFINGDKKGWSGAEDWFNLGDDSVSLWTSLYDFLKQYARDGTGLFSNSSQIGVGEIGMIGTMLGMIGTFCGMMNKIESGEIEGGGDAAGELVKLGNDMADLFKNGIEIGQLKDKFTSIDSKSLGNYLTIVKAYTTAISKSFSSYQKYAADGEMTVSDWAEVGVDSSVAGLYKMVESLTFGILSEKTLGISSDDISKALKDGGSAMGTKTVNYINNNPQLKEWYQNSNELGRFYLFYSVMPFALFS